MCSSVGHGFRNAPEPSRQPAWGLNQSACLDSAESAVVEAAGLLKRSAVRLRAPIVECAGWLRVPSCALQAVC